MTEQAPTQRNQITAAGPSVDASNIPVLETARLRLRAFELTDHPSACALWADPEVVEFIGGAKRSEADVWTAMARSFGHWALLGYGFWAIADRTTNRYLGEIGYLEGLRDISPTHTGTPEAGWALAQHCWGQGFASEALTAINLWSDRALETADTLCIIDPAHDASLRVAQKCGYQPLRTAKLAGSPIEVLSRKRGGQTR